MGNVPVSQATEEENQQKKKTSMFDVFCGNRTAKDIVKNIEVNEIILSKTYSYPKGTYNVESIKLFNQKEKQLFYFSSRNNVAAVRYLTINGVNINILDEDRTSPLHLACRTGSLQMVEELINQGAMINLPDLVGWTPLHIGCFQTRPDVILLLLKNGANYKFKNRDKLTPFELCANSNECLEIYNNFTIHERIELMRIIQLQKMKLEYIENYIKNYDGNWKWESKDQCRDQYINSLSNIRNDCEDIEPINTEILDHDQEYEIIKNQSIKSLNGQNIQDIINDNDNVDDGNHNINITDLNKEDDNGEEEDNNENDDIDEVPNEFVNYYDEENKRKKKENADFTEKYLSKYKYIPKKHKFYLQYEMCNGKVSQKSISNCSEFHSAKQNSNSLLIRLPNQFPVMTSIQQLNRETDENVNANERRLITHPDLLDEEHEKYKAYDNTSDCDEVNLHFNQFSIAGNKSEGFNNSSPNCINDNNNKSNPNASSIQDESTIIEDRIVFPNEIANLPKHHRDSEKIVINDPLTQSFIANDHQLFYNFFNHHLKATKETIEELLFTLFHFDYKFSLLLMLTLNKNNNTFESLVHIIRKAISLKQLKSMILIGFDHSPLLDVFFSSFNTSKLKIKDILSKVMSNIFNPKDIFIIDRISKSFAATFYSMIQTTEESKLIKSENVLNCLIFSLLITEMAINSPSSLEQKEKIICDLMIILKYINEGECFNQDYLNSFIKYIKSTGFFNKTTYRTIDTEDKFSLGIIISSSFKSYYAYYFGKGIFVLFATKKTNEITRLICLNVSLLSLQTNGSMIVAGDKYDGKKGKNVFILHNKKKTIQIKQYDNIKLFLDDKQKLNDIMQTENLK